MSNISEISNGLVGIYYFLTSGGPQIEPSEMAEYIAKALDILSNYPEWISVKEEVPDMEYDIWMCTGDEVYKGFYDIDLEKFRVSDGYIISGVTHWMPVFYPVVKHEKS